MRKINKMDVLRLVLVLALVAGIGLAFGAVGRFVPTHKIVQPVYCGSCHPEQVQELSATTHLGKFSEEIHAWTKYINGTGTGATKNSTYPNARIISGACVMCHNYWENFKWYGVQNFALQPYDGDNPDIGTLDPATDIYGNAVSPYGLGSTKEYYMNVSNTYSFMNPDSGRQTQLYTEPWSRGLDTYQYTDSSGVNHTRLDYVWSAISAVSPGPVGFIGLNKTTGAKSSCGGGTVEHGMCHIAAGAVALSFIEKKNEVMDYPNNTGTFGGNPPAAGRSGAGIFFTHEMAFTTAQYAAKPVKICGACHVLKLPPMRWGGEPWAISDIKVASANGASIVAMEEAIAANTDPFGFRPSYNDLVGTTGEGMQMEKNYLEGRGRAEDILDLPVAFRTPDWAHSNVPCIRCHAHAGINGETVSDNAE